MQIKRETHPAIGKNAWMWGTKPDWQDNSDEIISLTTERLFQPDQAGVLAWLNSCGISNETAKEFSLGYVNGGRIGGADFSRERGITIPYLKAGRIDVLAIRRPVARRDYYYITGEDEPTAFNLASIAKKKAVFVVDTELEVIALSSQIPAEIGIISPFASNSRQLCQTLLAEPISQVIVQGYNSQRILTEDILESFGITCWQVDLPNKVIDICQAKDLDKWVESMLRYVEQR